MLLSGDLVMFHASIGSLFVGVFSLRFLGDFLPVGEEDVGEEGVTGTSWTLLRRVKLAVSVRSFAM